MMNNTQYIINKTGINQYALHAGFSLPIGAGSTLDMGFKFGYRGTTDSGLLREQIFGATMTLSFGEAWFIRPDR